MKAGLPQTDSSIPETGFRLNDITKMQASERFSSSGSLHSYIFIRKNNIFPIPFIIRRYISE